MNACCFKQLKMKTFENFYCIFLYRIYIDRIHLYFLRTGMAAVENDAASDVEMMEKRRVEPVSAHVPPVRDLVGERTRKLFTEFLQRYLIFFTSPIIKIYSREK